MEEVKPEKQAKNRDNEGKFKPGISGNPNGRPKGKTLKDFARELLALKTDQDKLDWLKDIPKEVVWKMAEGNPPQSIEHSGTLNISQVLNELENGQTLNQQGVENKPSLQNPGQEQKPDTVQAK